MQTPPLLPAERFRRRNAVALKLHFIAGLVLVMPVTYFPRNVDWFAHEAGRPTRLEAVR